MELAQLLGFKNYAEKITCQLKWQNHQNKLLNFLTGFSLSRGHPQGEKELAELTHFAKTHYGVEKLEPWDLWLTTAKNKQHLFSIDDEQLRPYFPEHRALSGLRKWFTVSMV